MNKRLRHGFGQLEVVVSTILVGVLMVSSFSSIAASRRSQTFESNKVRGLAIAEALLAEISQLPMRDPECVCGYGLGSGESGDTRSNYDDVDDYHNLIDSPPRSKNGSACVGYTDLSRSVKVDRVTQANWGNLTFTYTGVYRITIRVLRNNLEVCRVVGYRTDGYAGLSLDLKASTIQ
jgi:hypothetical protein